MNEWVDEKYYVLNAFVTKVPFFVVSKLEYIFLKKSSSSNLIMMLKLKKIYTILLKNLSLY